MIKTEQAYELDKIDGKILYELDLNSRQSFKQLGKKVGLGAETTFHRIKRLEEKGIIDKYLTIINPHKLGFQNYRLLLKLKNTDEKTEQRIIDFFKKSELTGWVVSIEGSWNLAVWFLIKNIYEFNKEYKKFKENFSNYVADEKLSILTDVFYYSRSYLIGKENEISFDINVPDKQQDVIEEEYKILEKLGDNSRSQIIDIAEYANLSEKTTIKKIKELEKRKIILGYGLKINLEKAGIEYYKVHIKLNNLKEKEKKEIEDFAFQNPNIVYMDNTISGYDLEFDVQVENKQQFNLLISEIKHKFQKNIENMDILNMAQEHKHVFLV